MKKRRLFFAHLLFFLGLWLGPCSEARCAEGRVKNGERDPLSDLKKEMLDEAQRINDYFMNAVTVYVYMDEEKAHIAALTAAKVAGNKQRRSMCNALEGIAADIMQSSMQVSAKKRIAMILLGLKDEIEEKEWDISDIKKGKAILRKMDADYAKALDQADPSVFARRHPKLFKD